MDATADESLAQKYNIGGFPTIKVFGADKKSPTDYQGARTADAITTEAMKATSNLVKTRKTGKSNGKSSGSSKSKGSKSAVVALDETNFNALVLESNDMWMVEFYAPWCGHCKALAPEWERAAATLQNDGIRLGAVDATAHQALASQYGVKGYPTIKVFNAGPKDTNKKKKGDDYNGPREADGIVDYARAVLDRTGAPVVVHELISPSVFSQVCGGTTAKLCAVLFVPHILDSGAAGRNSYLEVFQSIAQEFRRMPFAFAWAEANAHPELESFFTINGNFPTVAVFSAEKKSFAVNRLSWSAKNVKDFMQGVLSGTEKTSAVAAMPAVNTVSAWDGKDGKLEVDEIPLDELFGDD